jgi:uncharacterized protein (TIGR03435 family)
MKSAIACVGLLVLRGLHAQPAPAPLSFEVASIKRSAPDAKGFFLQIQPGGGLRATGATVKNLIALAYGLREFQISGGPRWADSDRFDINARAERSPASETPAADPLQMTAEQRQNGSELRERVKSLLAERFQLAVHSESKEQDVYALVVAKNGPKVREAKSESGHSIRGQRGSITGQGTTMQLLAANLSNQIGSPVLDRTGLPGNYDFKLEWTSDLGRGSGSIGGSAAEAEAPLASDPEGPSVFTALQEQLGLRLERQKGSVKVLVIDRLEKPSEN